MGLTVKRCECADLAAPLSPTTRPGCSPAGENQGRRRGLSAVNDLPASIRRASADDLDAIVGLHTRSRTAYYRSFLPDEVLADPARAARRRAVLARDLRSPDHIVLCAEQGGQLSGFAAIGPCALPGPDPQTSSQLGFFFVIPARLRQRIGIRLHQACIQRWQAQAVTAARVWVMEFNQRPAPPTPAGAGTRRPPPSRRPHRPWLPPGHPRASPLATSEESTACLVTAGSSHRSGWPTACRTSSEPMCRTSSETRQRMARQLSDSG